MHDLDVLTQGSQNTIRGKKSQQSELVKVTQAEAQVWRARSFVSQMKDQETRSRIMVGSNAARHHFNRLQ